METYVRTHLLPYDFSLSAEQEIELFTEVRLILDNAPNEELFSIAIRGRIEEAVEAKIQPWRDETGYSVRPAARKCETPHPITSHLSYASATPGAVEQLKQRFRIDDTKTWNRNLDEKSNRG